MGAQSLLDSLARVEAQRRERAANVQLACDVVALKSFQQARLALTYPDLLAHPRWAAAARFFLEELYGPKDFAERDRGLGRVVPTLVRLFPQDVVATVDRLLQLHAVSEELDSDMARSLAAQIGDFGRAEGTSRLAFGSWDGRLYGMAWRVVGRRSEREWQIRTVVEIGQQLDTLTRLPGLRQSLKLMRAPASLAGLGALQSFLERGFDAFRAMGGAKGFLDTIESRESIWLEWLYEPEGAASDAASWLGQFP